MNIRQIATGAALAGAIAGATAARADTPLPVWNVEIELRACHRDAIRSGQLGARQGAQRNDQLRRV